MADREDAERGEEINKQLDMGHEMSQRLLIRVNTLCRQACQCAMDKGGSCFKR